MEIVIHCIFIPTSSFPTLPFLLNSLRGFSFIDEYFRNHTPTKLQNSIFYSTRNLIFSLNLLNFQHNRKVLRRSFSLSEKWHCFFIFFRAFHVLCRFPYPTHVRTYLECSCIWYFHFVYWLNSIHFIWLYSADCCSFLTFPFLMLRVVCYRQKIIKAIIISNLILNVFVFFMQHILSYHTKLNYYCNHSKGEKAKLYREINSHIGFFKHVHINQWAGDNAIGCNKTSKPISPEAFLSQ